jgi:TonB family protein
MRSSVVLIVLLMQAGVTQRGLPEVTIRDIKSHVGKEVVACGRVVTYSCDDTFGLLTVDLDTPSSAPGITIAISRQHWPDSSGRTLTDSVLFGKVCARGTVRKSSGRYQVVVNGSDAIELASGPHPPLPPFAPGAVHTCAEGVTPPMLVKEVKPNYTREAMEELQAGFVYLEAVVLADGTIGDVRPTATMKPELGLTEQAVIAVKKWRFRPATRGGASVPVVVTFEMHFTLK